MSDTATQITVWIPALLRDMTYGQQTVAVTGTTLGQVVDALEQRFPGIKERLCDADGIRPSISVAVNGQLSSRRLGQVVPSGAEIGFVPAIGGG